MLIDVQATTLKEGAQESPRSLDVPADGLSIVLDAIRLRGEHLCYQDFDEAFEIRHSPNIIGFHLVEHGTMLAAFGNARSQVLTRGDVLLFPHGIEHVLVSVTDAHVVSQNKLPGEDEPSQAWPVTPCRWLTGTFCFDPVLARHLMNILPPFIHITSENGRPSKWLDVAGAFLIQEIRNRQPGFKVMISRILELVLTHCLRTWATSDEARPGWLSAVMDKQLGPALTAIHSTPDRPWTVGELAELTGMSKSSFADRFRMLVGTSPASYATAWRLDRAGAQLRLTNDSVAEIAARTGYKSVAAFSRAFRAQFGMTPQRWRDEQRPVETKAGFAS